MGRDADVDGMGKYWMGSDVDVDVDVDGMGWDGKKSINQKLDVMLSLHYT